MAINSKNLLLIAEIPSDNGIGTESELLTESAVTQKSFNGYKVQAEKELGELKTEVKTLKETVDSPLGSTVGYISISAAILALIGVILALIFKNIVSDKVNELIKKSKSQDETIRGLSEQISDLKNKLDKLENENKKQPQIFEKTSVADASIPIKNTSTSNINSISSVPAPPPPPPRPVVVEKYLGFVQDFNALANQQSAYEARKASDEFLRKYNVQAFSCTNFEARMNDPVPPPQFGSAASPQKAEYWAYEFEPGIFAVIPNVKTYTDNHHAARAMGEVFKSNFRQGDTYSKIFVEKPAIFKGMWNLENPGKLELK